MLQVSGDACIRVELGVQLRNWGGGRKERWVMGGDQGREGRQSGGDMTRNVEGARESS
jgi:hypothetical protein